MDQHFVNRPVFPLQERIFKGNGLIMSNGQVWKEQTRFALTALRNFGLGKKSLEERIQEEARHLTEAIKEENGEHFIGQMLLDDATYMSGLISCQLYSIFPRIMEFLPGSHQTVFRNWEKLKLFVSQMIEKHKKDWNPDETRDFIDAYLKEMAKKATSSFHEDNLIISTLDLFFAGTETTSTTLRWALLYLALHPEIQEKVHAEIDRVIGQEQQPSVAARDSMPYTNAVIHEVQRMGNIIPLNVPREVTANTTLAGYHLPKGPRRVGHPDTFNPEHFLENGQFKKREAFLPFSIGEL
uniref:Cytochrome P450 family 2 subfamily J member 90, pseudo n=1 Tax=Microcebus murinus TaxID=30608 RepID=A0A8C5VLJ1_MICMU